MTGVLHKTRAAWAQESVQRGASKMQDAAMRRKIKIISLAYARPKLPAMYAQRLREA